METAMIKRLLTPRQVAEIDGVGMTTVYRRLSLGEYDGVKDGRQTKISEESIMRRRASLPKATYGARKGVFGIPKVEAASA
jgi:excisionase family DNA binding protein